MTDRERTVALSDGGLLSPAPRAGRFLVSVPAALLSPRGPLGAWLLAPALARGASWLGQLRARNEAPVED